MKQIELDKFERLLQIVGPYPSTAVAHFSNMNSAMVHAIYSYCQQKNYAYQLNCTDNAFYTEVVKTFEGDDGIKIIDFSLNRPRYLIQGKSYEFIFVTVDLEDEIRDDFLKKTHEILRNSGNILLFLPKITDSQRHEWEKLLEQNYYVATNTIDDLFEHYDVMISKKMHGWGDK